MAYIQTRRARGSLVALASLALAATAVAPVGGEKAAAATENPQLALAVSGILGDNGWFTSIGTFPYYQITSAWGAEDRVTMRLAGANEETRSWTGLRNAGIPLVHAGVTDVIVAARTVDGEETSDVLQVKFDPERPTAYAIAAPERPRVGDSWIVDFACSDAHSGIAECGIEGYERGERITFDKQGLLSLYVKAKDNAGNVTVSQVAIDVQSGDRTAPLLEVEMPAPDGTDGWYRGPVSLGLVATDDESGVFTFYVTMDGREDMHSSDGRPLVVSGDGEHEVKVRAVDRAGNLSEPQTFAFSIDGTSPTIVLESASPDGATYVEGAEVPLQFTCDDATSGVADCGVGVEPGELLPTDVVGQRTLTLRALDAAGNETIRTLRYTVEAAPGEVPGGDPGSEQPGQSPDDQPGQSPDNQPGAGTEPTAPTPDKIAHSTLAATGSSSGAVAMTAGVAAILIVTGGLLLLRRRTVSH